MRGIEKQIFLEMARYKNNQKRFAWLARWIIYNILLARCFVFYVSSCAISQTPIIINYPYFLLPSMHSNKNFDVISTFHEYFKFIIFLQDKYFLQKYGVKFFSKLYLYTKCRKMKKFF